MTELNVQHIPCSRIASPVQVRPVDPEHVERLAESMKAHGQEVPIIVHKALDSRGMMTEDFDLGPGRHRLEAAQRLGWETIAAIVKGPASMAELRAEQVRENLERKDLSPLEEAELAADLLDQVGGDVAEAAAIMGRPAKWVELRAALTRLSTKVRGWVLDGFLPLGHAQIIARIADHERQQEIADSARAHERGGQAQPLWRVKQMVEREGRTLAGVAWRMDAAFGATGRACFACPQNSANSAGLFDDGAPKKPTCLDGACFGDKSRLAGSGARKAATYLLNEGLKRTPADAEKAAAAREVPFVTTSAVLSAATRTAELKKDRAQAKAEGLPPPSKQPKAESPQAKLEEAESEWLHKVAGLVDKATTGKPLVTALLTLLERVPGGDFIERKKPKDQAVVRGFLAKLGKVDGALLLEVAKHVDARYGCFNLPNEYAPDAAEALGIKLPARPTLEQFKPKAKPVAKPGAAPTTKKKSRAVFANNKGGQRQAKKKARA